MAIFQRAGMRKGGSLYSIFGSYDKFGYDIFADFKLRGLQFHFIKQLKNDHSNFKALTKFKSQALHIIRIKYWKARGSGNPPFLIPALWKIAILGLKMKISILFCTRLYILPNSSDGHPPRPGLFGSTGPEQKRTYFMFRFICSCPSYKNSTVNKYFFVPVSF